MALALIIHIFLGSTIAGVAVVAVLVAGYGTLWPIVIAALVGLVVALPASWMIARTLTGR